MSVGLYRPIFETTEPISMKLYRHEEDVIRSDIGYFFSLVGTRYFDNWEGFRLYLIIGNFTDVQRMLSGGTKLVAGIRGFDNWEGIL